MCTISWGELRFDETQDEKSFVLFDDFFSFPVVFVSLMKEMRKVSVILVREERKELGRNM